MLPFGAKYCSVVGMMLPLVPVSHQCMPHVFGKVAQRHPFGQDRKRLESAQQLYALQDRPRGMLYRRDVLLEDYERERSEGRDAKLEDFVGTDCEWELVSINARPTPEPEPLTPDTMARNFLELPGGTKADYTAEEFARAILYWSCRAMLGEE